MASRASLRLPFITAYDPPGTSEGTLDPMGLYQIADQLAVELVPAVRERMLRVRFLSAMAIGALVTEGIDGDPRQPESAPYLAWEWLVVEALIRSRDDDNELWGVPGTRVGRNAIRNHGYLDARSYLKTPRIFGFHGVYKRLAIQLGIVDVHLGPGPQAEPLAEAWARARGFSNLRGARELIEKWKVALRHGMGVEPPRTRPGWTTADWAELADGFAPNKTTSNEKRFLRELLLAEDDRRLGALPEIWELHGDLGEEFEERELHERLEKRAPHLGPLIAAIRTYEEFARNLQDAFDILRAEAGRPDANGYAVPLIAGDPEFRAAAGQLAPGFEGAYRALGEVAIGKLAPQGLLREGFHRFAMPLSAQEAALALCEHHEAVQRDKSADGKRPWFDRIGADRIYIRYAYRVERPARRPDAYVHAYRGWPIRRFREDLS